eukprot:scaffold73117_cov35-Prasinocladus_malaysianus.AAC.1
MWMPGLDSVWPCPTNITLACAVANDDVDDNWSSVSCHVLAKVLIRRLKDQSQATWSFAIVKIAHNKPSQEPIILDLS